MTYHTACMTYHSWHIHIHYGYRTYVMTYHTTYIMTYHTSYHVTWQNDRHKWYTDTAVVRHCQCQTASDRNQFSIRHLKYSDYPCLYISNINTVLSMKYGFAMFYLFICLTTDPEVMIEVLARTPAERQAGIWCADDSQQYFNHSS